MDQKGWNFHTGSVLRSNLTSFGSSSTERSLLRISQKGLLYKDLRAMHPTGVEPVIFGFVEIVGLNCLYCKFTTYYFFLVGLSFSVKTRMSRKV